MTTRRLCRLGSVFGFREMFEARAVDVPMPDLEPMPWAQPVLAEKLRLVDGRVELPTRPGLGLVWDAAAIKRWTARV